MNSIVLDNLLSLARTRLSITPHVAICSTQDNISIQDAGLQQVGFLLGSCGVNWVLTSESCLKNLPRDDAGSGVASFKGWPKLHWFQTEDLTKPPKDWHPPHMAKDKKMAAYIEV